MPFVYDANDGSGYSGEHVMARLMVLGGTAATSHGSIRGTIRVPNSIINIYETSRLRPPPAGVPHGKPGPGRHRFEMTLPPTIGDKALVRAGFGLASATEAGPWHDWL